MTTQTATTERILIAVDDSPASTRAVAYVGKFVAANPGVTVQLLHVLPPIPPVLLEHGGTATSDEEHRQLGHEGRGAREKRLREAEENAKPVLEKMRNLLIGAGLDVSGIETACHVSYPGDSVADGVLETALKEGFGTIAIGRSSFPWYREIVHRHVGNELKRKARGPNVWVIE